MQMRRRKYIRFDFTQALHTRATTAERRDYRIIARTRSPDHSLTRALARGVHSVATAHRVHSRSFRATAGASPLKSWFAHILWASPTIVVARAGAISSAGGTRLTRVRQREKQQHRSRRAYQIETARILIAIEFFLVVIITFLSLRRCNRRLLRASRAENQVIRGA
jgi:hypothetical protein